MHMFFSILLVLWLNIHSSKSESIGSNATFAPNVTDEGDISTTILYTTSLTSTIVSTTDTTNPPNFKLTATIQISVQDNDDTIQQLVDVVRGLIQAELDEDSYIISITPSEPEAENRRRRRLLQAYSAEFEVVIGVDDGGDAVTLSETIGSDAFKQALAAAVQDEYGGTVTVTASTAVISSTQDSDTPVFWNPGTYGDSLSHWVIFGVACAVLCLCLVLLVYGCRKRCSSQSERRKSKHEAMFDGGQRDEVHDTAFHSDLKNAIQMHQRSSWLKKSEEPQPLTIQVSATSVSATSVSAATAVVEAEADGGGGTTLKPEQDVADTEGKDKAIKEVKQATIQITVEEHVEEAVQPEKEAKTEEKTAEIENPEMEEPAPTTKRLWSIVFMGLHALFDLYADDEHKMDIDALCKAMREFGLVIDSSPALKQQIWTEFTDDNAKEIDFNDFMSTISAFMDHRNQDSLWTMFQIFDVDSSGYLEVDELAEMLAAQQKLAASVTNERRHTVTEQTVPQFFEKARKFVEEHDVNKDGKISFEEYKTWRMSECPVYCSVKHH